MAKKYTKSNYKILKIKYFGFTALLFQSIDKIDSLNAKRLETNMLF